MCPQLTDFSKWKIASTITDGDGDDDYNDDDDVIVIVIVIPIHIPILIPISILEISFAACFLRSFLGWFCILLLAWAKCSVTKP